jgi:two-component sensor histidine kinase
MANQPNADIVLQKLVDTALELCRAQSAGVSILEKGTSGDVFRWRAVAGPWSAYRGELMPRESPCGTVLERDAMTPVAPCDGKHDAEDITLPIAEALLIPLRVSGNPVGTLWIISHDERRQFDVEDQRLITSLGRFAEDAYQLLSQERLAKELTATQRLQEISSELLGERQVDGLYEKIVDAAASIMHSDFASMQIYHAERGELSLLANRGFSSRAANFWQRVTPKSATSCGIALKSSQRVIIADIEKDASVLGEDLEMCRAASVCAMQSTPLMSRDGEFLGMISTHWRQPYRPQAQELQHLDILARQAADLIERSLAEQRTRVLLREVSHRAKNILAIVQGMVRQTAMQKDPNVFSQDLSARLASLARSHDLLAATDWQGVQLGELVRSQVSHLCDLGGTRITFDGPALQIAPRSAQTIGIAVHELATNALKFGALSNINGFVVVQWKVSERSEPRFIMTWRERGGPSVSSPQRKGFGNTAMIRMIEHAFDADVALDYDPNGVTWKMNAPLAAVLQGNGLPA